MIGTPKKCCSKFLVLRIWEVSHIRYTVHGMCYHMHQRWTPSQSLESFWKVQIIKREDKYTFQIFFSQFGKNKIVQSLAKPLVISQRSWVSVFMSCLSFPPFPLLCYIGLFFHLPNTDKWQHWVPSFQIQKPDGHPVSFLNFNPSHWIQQQSFSLALPWYFWYNFMSLLMLPSSSKSLFLTDTPPLSS